METADTVSVVMEFLAVTIFPPFFQQIRVELLMELALMANRHVLLVGPRACGKSAMAAHFLRGRGELSTIHNYSIMYRRAIHMYI